MFLYMMSVITASNFSMVIGLYVYNKYQLHSSKKNGYDSDEMSDIKKLGFVDVEDDIDW